MIKLNSDKGQPLEMCNPLYELVFQNAANAILVADAKTGEIIDCNKAAEDLMGYSKQQLIGMHQSELHPKNTREKYKKKFHNHIEKFHVGNFEEVLEHKNGTKIPVIISDRIIEFNGREIVVGLFTNITERKKVEEQNNVFLRFIEASGQGLGMADLNGRITYANKTLCNWMREDGPEKFIGSQIIDYYPDELQKYLSDVILPAALGKGEWTGEIPLVSKGGRVFEAIQNVFLVRDTDDKPLYFANVIIDITERKKIERKLNEKLTELKLFHDVTVERELKMEELRIEIDNLREKIKTLGRSSP